MADYELNPTFTGSAYGKLSVSLVKSSAPTAPPPDPSSVTRKLVELFDAYQGRIAGNLPDWVNDRWPEVMGVIEWLMKSGDGLFRGLRGQWSERNGGSSRRKPALRLWGNAAVKLRGPCSGPCPRR